MCASARPLAVIGRHIMMDVSGAPAPGHDPDGVELDLAKDGERKGDNLGQRRAWSRPERLRAKDQGRRATAGSTSDVGDSRCWKVPWSLVHMINLLTLAALLYERRRETREGEPGEWPEHGVRRVVARLQIYQDRRTSTGRTDGELGREGPEENSRGVVGLDGGENMVERGRGSGDDLRRVMSKGRLPMRGASPEGGGGGGSSNSSGSRSSEKTRQRRRGSEPKAK